MYKMYGYYGTYKKRLILEYTDLADDPRPKRLFNKDNCEKAEQRNKLKVKEDDDS